MEMTKSGQRSSSLLILIEKVEQNEDKTTQKSGFFRTKGPDESGFVGEVGSSSTNTLLGVTLPRWAESQKKQAACSPMQISESGHERKDRRRLS